MQKHMISKEIQTMKDHITDLDKLKQMLLSVQSQLKVTSDLQQQLKRSKTNPETNQEFKK